MTLRVINDDTDPLSLEELKAHGDTLLVGAGRRALDAMRASARPEFVIGKAVTIREVRNIHRLASEAAHAWRDVEATLGELLYEVEKATRGAK